MDEELYALIALLFTVVHVYWLYVGEPNLGELNRSWDEEIRRIEFERWSPGQTLRKTPNPGEEAPNSFGTSIGYGLIFGFFWPIYVLAYVWFIGRNLIRQFRPPEPNTYTVLSISKAGRRVYLDYLRARNVGEVQIWWHSGKYFGFPELDDSWTRRLRRERQSRNLIAIFKGPRTNLLMKDES